jgi:hypothetical protein
MTSEEILNLDDIKLGAMSSTALIRAVKVLAARLRNIEAGKRLSLCADELNKAKSSYKKAESSYNEAVEASDDSIRILREAERDGEDGPDQ